MQTPIISPWLIYLSNATFGIEMILIFAGFALAGAAYWFWVQQNENRFYIDIWYGSLSSLRVFEKEEGE